MASQTPPQQQEEEEHPEHIQRFGPGNISFVPSRTPQAQRSLRSRSSLKDDKSSIGCEFADDHHLTCLSDLFPAPIVRQYIQGGRLYRERDERVPDRFELFLDLILVGIVHQLAESAGESTSGATIGKVVLTFYCCWSIWTDTRTWLNQSGVDDISQRTQVLAILVCIVGFSVNASAIHVGGQATGEAAGEAASAVAHRFVRRATEVAGEAATAGAESAGVLEHAGPQPAVVAATAFFLVAKLIRILTYLGYSWLMPEFRMFNIGRAAGLIVVSLIFIGCAFVDTIGKVAILASVGLCTDFGSRFAVGALAGIERRRSAAQAKKRAASGIHPDAQAYLLADKARMIPAYNLEHFVERTAAFTVIVLGESIVSLLYIAAPGSIGLSDEFLRATFGLAIVFCFNAIYFDALSRKFVHAIRRHWGTHMAWDIVHFPMLAGLITASAALNLLVLEHEVPQAIRWQYGGGMAIAIFCVTVTGLLHENLDPAGVTMLGHRGRAALRFAVALFYALFPLVKSINDTQFLGSLVGVLALLAVVEIWAKLGREETDPTDHTIVEDVAAEQEIAEEEAEECARKGEQVEAEAGSSSSMGKKSL